MLSRTLRRPLQERWDCRLPAGWSGCPCSCSSDSARRLPGCRWQPAFESRRPPSPAFSVALLPARAKPIPIPAPPPVIDHSEPAQLVVTEPREKRLSVCGRKLQVRVGGGRTWHGRRRAFGSLGWGARGCRSGWRGDGSDSGGTASVEGQRGACQSTYGNRDARARSAAPELSFEGVVSRRRVDRFGQRRLSDALAIDQISAPAVAET